MARDIDSKFAELAKWDKQGDGSIGHREPFADRQGLSGTAQTVWCFQVTLRVAIEGRNQRARDLPLLLWRSAMGSGRVAAWEGDSYLEALI